MNLKNRLIIFDIYKIIMQFMNKGKIAIVLIWLCIFGIVYWVNNNSNNEQESNKDYIKENYENKTYKKWELIIKFKDIKWKSKDEVIKTNANKLNVKIKDKLSSESIALVEIDDNINIDKAIASYWKNENIEYVQPNYIYELDEFNPNDDYFHLQWSLKNTRQVVNSITWTLWADIKWAKAMEIFSWTQVGSWWIVAIIDDWVFWNHIDLIDKMWNGENCKDENGNYLWECEFWYDFYENKKNPTPWLNDTHWTHVAWIIGANTNNNEWISWVNPNVRIMWLRVGDWTMDRIKAINFAKHNGATVINASWSCYTKNQWWTHAVCGTPYSFNDLAMKEAIEWFPWLFITTAWNGNWDADSSGDNIDTPDSTNNNDVNPPYPCAHNSENIICVTSTNNLDNLDFYANFGSISVDVWAPWWRIWSTIQEYIDSTKYYDEEFESYQTWTYQPLFTTTNGNFWVINSLMTWRDNVLIADMNRYPYTANSNTFIDSIWQNLSGHKEVVWESYIACDTEYKSWANSDYFEIHFWNWNSYDFILSGNEVTYDLNSDSSGYSFWLIKINLKQKYLINDFKFRIKWITNSTDNNYWWCFFDDIKLYKNNFDNIYVYKSWTSMAAPHVSWLASLLQWFRPNFTPLQVKEAIMNYWDSLPSLNGKTVSWKRINAYKTLAMFTNPSPSYITWVQLIEWLTWYSVNWYFNANPYFSWDYPQNQWVFSGFKVTINNINWTVYSGSQTNNNLSWLNLTDWNYEIKVIWENDIKAWNETILNFNVDTTPPSIPIINDTNLNYNWNIELSWNFSADNWVWLEKYYYEIWDSINFDSLILSWFTSNTWVNYGLSDWTFYWRVKANDLLYNKSWFSQVWTFIIDTTPPNAPTNIKINNNWIINISNVFNSTIIWSWEITDNWWIWYANFEDTNNLTIFLTWTINNWEIYKDWINFSILEDWIINYEIFVQDLAGNAWQSSTWTINKSTLNPVLSIEFNSWANYTNSLTWNLFIQSNKDGVYTIQGSGIVNNKTWSINNSKNETIQLTSGDWEKHFVLNFEDYFNNIDFVSGMVILDQTNPTINITSHINNQIITWNNGIIQWIISDNYFASWISLNGNFVSLNKINQLSGTFSQLINLSWWNNNLIFNWKDAAWNETNLNLNLIRMPHNSWTQILNIAHNSANIQFKSDLNSIWYIEYWTSSTNLNQILTWNTNTNHSFTLNNLIPNQTYYFKIKSTYLTFDSNYSQTFSFKTLQENVWNLVYTWVANLTWEFNSNTGSLGLKFSGNITIFDLSGQNNISFNTQWLNIIWSWWYWTWLIMPPTATSSSWTIVKEWIWLVWNYREIWSEIAQLQFSWSQILVQIFVWTWYNDFTLKVYRSIDFGNNYSYYTNCIVSNGYCSFFTNHLSKFALWEIVEDNTPDAFDFKDNYWLRTSRNINTNAIIVGWINTWVNITTTNWIIIINGIVWTNNWIVYNWDQVIIQVRTPATWWATLTTTVTIWTISDNFTITTATDWWGWGGGWWWSFSSNIVNQPTEVTKKTTIKKEINKSVLDETADWWIKNKDYIKILNDNYLKVKLLVIAKDLSSKIIDTDIEVRFEKMKKWFIQYENKEIWKNELEKIQKEFYIEWNRLNKELTNFIKIYTIDVSRSKVIFVNPILKGKSQKTIDDFIKKITVKILNSKKTDNQKIIMLEHLNKWVLYIGIYLKEKGSSSVNKAKKEFNKLKWLLR